MSQTSAGNAAPGGPYRKPRADLYTMLLLISLAAIITAIVCLFMDVASYPGKPPYKDVPAPPAAMLPLERTPGLALTPCPSPIGWARGELHTVA